MPDYLPVYQPAEGYPLTASAAITGGQLLEVTGSSTVGPAAAGSAKFVGVAAFDAISGQRVTLFPADCVHEVTASGSVTAGDLLKCAAAGQVSTLVQGTDADRLYVGTALTSATSGNLVRFLGR